MFLNNAVYNYINKDVDAYILKKGAELMKFSFVDRVTHAPAIKTITAVVKDVNKVSIVYESPFNLSSVSCGCKNSMPCEHLVAVMYQILKMKDNEFKVEKVATTSSAKKQQAKIQETKSKTVLTQPFKGPMPSGKLNTFKQVPFNDKKSLDNLLNKISPRYPKVFGYNYTHDINLSDEGLLQFRIINKFSKYSADEEYFNNQDVVAEAIVSFENQSNVLRIKCNKCAEDRMLLCDHQAHALNTKNLTDILFSEEWKNRDNLVQTLSEKMGVAPTKFNKLYKINFKNGKAEAQSILNNFLDAEKLNKIKADISKISGSNGSQIDGYLERLSLFGNDNKMNALFWIVDISDAILPELLEGTASKNKDKLTSNIDFTEDPKYVDEYQMQLIKKFIQLENRFDGNYEDVFKKSFIRILKEHLTVLKSMIHYHSDDDYTGHYKLKKKDLLAFNFTDQYADLFIEVKEDDLFYKCRFLFKAGDFIINPQKDLVWLTETFFVHKEKAYIFNDPAFKTYYDSFGKQEIVADKDNPKAFLEFLHLLNQKFEVQYPKDYIPEIAELENPEWQIYLKEAGNFIIIQPKLNFQDEQMISIPMNSRFHPDIAETGETIFYEINTEDEDRFIDFLSGMHPALKESMEQTGSFHIHINDLVKNAWFLSFFESCKLHDITVFGQENLKTFRFNTNPANISLGISSGIDWFDINVSVEFGEQKVALKQWVESIKNNEKYVRLDDGSLGLIPDSWFDKLKEVILIADEEKGQLTLSKFKLGAIDSFFSEISDDALYEDIRQKLKQLNHYEFNKTYPLPKILTANLREYQLMGFQWLKALSDLGFGGCLADDMGLGKTVQTIALLADQKENNKGTSLVIVPRSLLFNWAAEIDKFCPALSYLNYHGTDRMAKKEEIFDYDLVITTYDTATNDIEFFKEKKFNYIVLDESQAIKNPNSKRYKAMRLLQANNRIVMTGTPIENNTFDLFAQFSFLNPGIFGSQLSFRNNFSQPIDKNSNEDTATLLRKIINPFLLRRTKEQVASDLPERTENVIYCEMDKVQRDYYEALKITIRQDIESNVKKSGFNKVRFKIIEGLLRLRQVCNSPLLVDKSLPGHKQSSVKIETLMDIVENDLGSHNALVFSQFTSMLDLIRKALDARHIRYAYLDGSTRDRKAAVEYFEQNDEIKLFLISLKAGNTGLNLIKADYVYIMDPWWNPAVEAQAIDRTHRIGQLKNIFAYKMICKNTIEEKILELQGKKKKLASELVVTDENILKSLDKDELISLFN